MYNPKHVSHNDLSNDLLITGNWRVAERYQSSLVCWRYISRWSPSHEARKGSQLGRLLDRTGSICTNLPQLLSIYLIHIEAITYSQHPSVVLSLMRVAFASWCSSAPILDVEIDSLGSRQSKSSLLCHALAMERIVCVPGSLCSLL